MPSSILETKYDGTPADLQNSTETGETEHDENDVTDPDLNGLVDGLEQVLAQRQLSPAQKQTLEEAEKVLLSLRDPAAHSSTSSYSHQQAYQEKAKYYNGYGADRTGP